MHNICKVQPSRDTIEKRNIARGKEYQKDQSCCLCLQTLTKGANATKLKDIGSVAED